MSKSKNNDLNIATEDNQEQPLPPLFWAVNAKYRGNRYKTGSRANVAPEDTETLLDEKIIRYVEV